MQQERAQETEGNSDDFFRKKHQEVAANLGSNFRIRKYI